MRKFFNRLCMLSLAMFTVAAVHAADHRDGPVVAGDPAADINDVFAWMSSDAQTINLIMTVFPGADVTSRFSDAVTYRFKTVSQSGYGATATDTVAIECTFDSEQNITCNLNDVNVTGNASNTNGIQSQDGRLRVFAGLRNDPFFFNFSGFRAVAETVTAAAPNLTFDTNGCPALDSATGSALRTQLQTEPNGDPAADDFAGQNVLAIVLAVDKTLLNSAGDIVSVDASTFRQ